MNHSNVSELAAAFDRIATSRRSVRGFLPQTVPVADIKAALEIAQRAPSNCNVQPWIVHVVSGAALERLRNALVNAFSAGQMTMDFIFTGLYQGVYKERQNDSAKQLYKAMGIAREDKAGRMTGLLRNYQFFDAPHAALVFMDEAQSLREAIDCGMYAQTLMLALQARGIDSCAQAAVSFCADTVREVLGIPSTQKMLFGIAFGYEDKAVAANNARVARAALSEAVTFYN